MGEGQKEKTMSIYYLKIRGLNNKSTEVPYLFGYYVDCIINTTKLKKAKELVIESLYKQGLNFNDFKYAGLFNSFEWEDNEHYSQLEEAEEIAIDSPNEPQFLEFHIWPDDDAD